MFVFLSAIVVPWQFMVVVAFPTGQESPTIETAAGDFGVLGIHMHGNHDFGCALQDMSARLVEIPFTWHRGQVVDAA